MVTKLQKWTWSWVFWVASHPLITYTKFCSLHFLRIWCPTFEEQRFQNFDLLDRSTGISSIFKLIRCCVSFCTQFCPAITKGPVETWAGFGQSVTFTCSTGGDKPKTIKWQKTVGDADSVIATGELLKFFEYKIALALISDIQQQYSIILLSHFSAPIPHGPQRLFGKAPRCYQLS